jgi:glycogen synthase
MSSPPTVAMVASAFYPSLGGVEELVRQHALERRRRGWKSIIAVNRWPRDLPETEKVDGLLVRRYAFRTAGGSLRQNLGAWLLGGRALDGFCRTLQDLAVDLMHVQCVSCNAHYAVLAKFRLGIPLVVSLQGELTMDATGLYQRKSSARQLYRDALQHADAITACSKQTLAEAEEFYGESLAHKARVVYNGVRLEEFSAVEPFDWPRPYILAIGRHVTQKGFDVLLRAFAAMTDRSHDLLIAGDGPERTALEGLTRELGLRESVKFLGKVDHDQAVRLFAGCSLFVLPSRHEPMGIVNLEAMAAGKAVVASNVGGVPELVLDGQTGLLVPPGDHAALANAISRLIGDPNLASQFGSGGRKRAKLFSWQALTDQYEAVYQQVLQKTA